MFLALMVIGLAGLLLMAVPAFGRHGHGPSGVHGRGGAGRLVAGHGGAGRAALVASSKAGAAAGAASATGREDEPETAVHRLLGLLPSPRAVCSVLALYGAFGNALVHAGHLPFGVAALVATIPALLVERLVVRPVWNLVFRFQGQPSTPLDTLLLSEAKAVVPFRNGRGLVSVVRDGRVVQLSATLRVDQRSLPVRVGERLRVDDVDARRERVTVSVLGLSKESSCQNHH